MALLRTLSRLLRRPAATPPAARFDAGARVRLIEPLGSHHKIWIPAGATGIVVAGDRARVSVELDSPRTVVTVPWAWVEDAAAAAPTLEHALPPPPTPLPTGRGTGGS